ncbi:MAG: AEC family transporter [Pseudomonadota bacterium]
MSALLDVILPVFLVIGFGYVARWRGLFPDVYIDGLTKFTQGFAIPCLLFGAIAELDLDQSFDPRLLFSFYLGAVAGFLAGLFGARLFFDRSWEDCIAIGFCGLFSNSVLLGLPITERAYGEDALASNYAIVALHAPFCYGLGITAMEIVRARTVSKWRLLRIVSAAMFKNALIIGIGLGFLFNLARLPIPGIAIDAVNLMARAALPAALFGLGGVLYRYRPEGDVKAILYICAVSLVLHPIVVWTVGRSVSLDLDAFRSSVLTAAMAPGINAYLFASMYGAARRVAASSVLIGTTLSILTIWCWLLILP